MSGSPDSVAAVAVLSDALRRRMYEFIRRQPRPVSRDEAAEHVGISRRLAAFHLDKLTRSGLLRSHYGRPAGTAGRPGRSPKLYEPADAEFSVSIPARQYDLIGEILLDAVEGYDSGDPAATADGAAGSPRAAALRVAEAKGAQLGTDARADIRPGRLGPERALSAAAQVLESLGYEPVRQAPDLLCLRNCPFHRLAARAPELVCGINQAFVSGVLRGLRADTVDAALVPRPGHCCVEVRRR